MASNIMVTGIGVLVAILMFGIIINLNIEPYDFTGVTPVSKKLTIFGIFSYIIPNIFTLVLFK